MEKHIPSNCSQPDCNITSVLDGLCEEHYLQNMKHKFARELTIEAIQTCMVEGKPPTKDGLVEELRQVKQWWDKAYASLSQGKLDDLFWEETAMVPEWCITIAKGTVDEETAHKEGRKPDSFLNFEKRHAQGYFKNLQAGLMSDGKERQEN